MDNYDKILNNDYGEMSFGLHAKPKKWRKRPSAVRGGITVKNKAGKTYYKGFIAYQGVRKYCSTVDKAKAERWLQSMREYLLQNGKLPE